MSKNCIDCVKRPRDGLDLLCSHCREILRQRVEAAAPKVVKVDAVRIHLLHHGIAVCGMAGVPSDWPPGHAWVGATQILRFRDDPNFCAACLAEFDRLWAAAAHRVGTEGE